MYKRSTVQSNVYNYCLVGKPTIIPCFECVVATLQYTSCV